jgi:hypothetical protein
MTSQEKSKDLINKFGKKLALKVVDEIQEIKSVYHDEESYDYWEEVKNELIKQQNNEDNTLNQ